MQHLDVIEHSDMRVLTTAQMAEAFNTNAKLITRNFQRNNERYTAGEHYFSLSGEDLKHFKASRQNDASLKYVSVLYLWTEKGAWLHAKSLNSEQAWTAYQMLIDSYYQATRALQNKGGDKLTLTLQDWESVTKRLEVLELQMRDAITLDSGEQKRVRAAVAERVYELAGREKGARTALFRVLYASIYERYGVESYRDLKQHQLQDALQFVKSWEGLKSNESIITG